MTAGVVKEGWRAARMQPQRCTSIMAGMPASRSHSSGLDMVCRSAGAYCSLRVDLYRIRQDELNSKFVFSTDNMFADLPVGRSLSHGAPSHSGMRPPAARTTTGTAQATAASPGITPCQSPCASPVCVRNYSSKIYIHERISKPQGPSQKWFKRNACTSGADVAVAVVTGACSTGATCPTGSCWKQSCGCAAPPAASAACRWCCWHRTTR